MLCVEKGEFCCLSWVTHLLWDLALHLVSVVISCGIQEIIYPPIGDVTVTLQSFQEFRTPPSADPQ